MALSPTVKKVGGTALVAVVAVGIVSLITSAMAKSKNATIAKIGANSPV